MDTEVDNADFDQWQANQPGYVESPDEVNGTVVGEVPPTPVRSTPIEKVRRFVGRTGDVAKPKIKSKATHPRISVEKVISRGWEMLARIVQPASMPIYRVLDMQAPVVGALLEDTIRGSVVDRILQPLARAEGKGEIAAALIGPPLIMGALTVKPGAAPVLIPALRESLRLWVDVAGSRMTEAAERRRQYEETDGKLVEELMRYLLQDIMVPEDEVPDAVEQPVKAVPPPPPGPVTRRKPAKARATV